jgi:4'-phosphopantetheinyl transferase
MHAVKDKVHVWVERSSDWSDLSAIEELLDDSERTRANRFLHESDRRNFIVAHGMKRRRLAEVLEVSDPSELRFGAYAGGKPYLRDANIHFNLSHSHGYSALAISKSPCGVDIEAYRPISQLPMLIEKTMTAREQKRIQSSPSQLRAFIDHWVLKEAFLKLSGIGLGFPLTSLCTVKEASNLQEGLSLLRQAAMFFRRGQGFSLAASSMVAAEFELSIFDNRLALLQGSA